MNLHPWLVGKTRRRILEWQSFNFRLKAFSHYGSSLDSDGSLWSSIFNEDQSQATTLTDPQLFQVPANPLNTLLASTFRVTIRPLKTRYHNSRTRKQSFDDSRNCQPRSETWYGKLHSLSLGFVSGEKELSVVVGSTLSCKLAGKPGMNAWSSYYTSITSTNITISTRNVPRITSTMIMISSRSATGTPFGPSMSRFIAILATPRGIPY